MHNPALHLELHRLRIEEAERRHARVRAVRDLEVRRSWMVRLGVALAAALAAGRRAFAETPPPKGVPGPKVGMPAKSGG
jgi:hypothetical protein